MRACPFGVRVMSLTEPAFVPPIWTRSPFTSWAAFRKYASIVYFLPPFEKSRKATTKIATTTAPIAASRPATVVPRIPGLRLLPDPTSSPGHLGTGLRRRESTERPALLRRFRLAACKRAVKAWLTLHPGGRKAAFFGLCPVAPRPRAGRARERRARAAIDCLLGGAEDRALERGGGDHLAPARVAVLALGRLLVVEQRPD